MKRGRGLRVLSLATALGLLPAAYVAGHGIAGEGMLTGHGMLGSALQLVSSATSAPSPSPSPGRQPHGAAAATPQYAPASVAPHTSSGAPRPSRVTARAIGAPATVAAAAKPSGRVEAAGVVPVPGPPGVPVPPLYPWQTSLWATATAYSNQPCLPPYRPGAHPPFTLTTTKNAAVVTWTHNGDAAVVAYWWGWHVDAGTLAQREAPIQWLKVTPPTGCTVVTATLPGLASGHYRLWMEMDVSTPEVGVTTSRVGLSSTSFDIP